MNVAFYIAKRYLFSKKSHNAINIISLVSVCGVVIVTAALVCALSVMNGFNGLVFGMFGQLDPELKITPAKGKVFNPEAAGIRQLYSLPGIDCISEVLQDNALIRYNGRQIVGIVKGVDDSYNKMTSIGSILVDGEFILHDEVNNYATLGIGVAAALGVNAGFVAPLEIMTPKRDENVNLSNPASSMNVEYCYIASVFQCNQQVYDESFMIAPIELTRSLFGYDNEVSTLEVKVKSGYNISEIKKQIRALLGDSYKVSDRYEQQSVAYKMMQSEKWMIFLILCFILIIALFNMVGSLSMLMIEKQDNVKTLRTLGADDILIRRIFLFEGWMISGFGACLGIIAGLALCLIQQNFGLVRMGEAGAFVVDSYPVTVYPPDLLVILATVLTAGFLSAWYPVYYLGERWLK